MYLFRVRNDFQSIFDIEKRIQLFKTIRLNAYINIFGGKSIFLEGGQKVVFFNYLCKICEKLYMKLKSTKNDVLIVFDYF